MPHSEMKSVFVSELCQILPDTPGTHRDLRGHGGAYPCCQEVVDGECVGACTDAIIFHRPSQQTTGRGGSTWPTPCALCANQNIGGTPKRQKIDAEEKYADPGRGTGGGRMWRAGATGRRQLPIRFRPESDTDVALRPRHPSIPRAHSRCGATLGVSGSASTSAIIASSASGTNGFASVRTAPSICAMPR